MVLRAGPRAWLLALVLVSPLLLSAPPAHAATFTVTTTQDAPHTTPLNGNCTSTLPGNPCTLRAAVQAANFLGGSHTIVLPTAGTYPLTVVGPNEDAAATGDLDLNGVTVTITNTSGGMVILDGNRTDRIFDIGPTTAAQLTMADVVLQNGLVRDQLSPSNFDEGGDPGGSRLHAVVEQHHRPE